MTYVLGLDIGATSVGWAAVKIVDGAPTGILAAGVRVFPAGTVGDIESGRDSSRNTQRREMRQQRRQIHRRAARVRAAFQLLQQHGLLPPGHGGRGDDRHAILLALDRQIAGDLGVKLDKLPYVLRAQALDRRLAPYELGRALLHLAQRRGFLSNRRVKQGDDEEAGIVKGAILSLEEEMRAAGTRTLGEFLSTVRGKIRCRYTARRMYEEEFRAIVAAQALSIDLVEKLRRIFFFQRPIGSQASKIGTCECEPGERRAPLAELDSQRFRLLQRCNDLRAEDDNGAEVVPITVEQRATLALALEQGDLTWPQVRASLGLPRTVHFNLERGGEKHLVGNRTAAKVRGAVGAAWDALPEADQAGIVRDLLTIDEPSGIERRALARWKFPQGAATALSALSLESGHLNLSRAAVRALTPRMRSGEAYATARKEVYGAYAPELRVTDTLPLVGALGDVRNPLVQRSLAEVRAVVNLLVKVHGKPEAVRVRLMREIKQPRKVREQSAARMRARQGEKKRAAEKILKELGAAEAPSFMVERVLLAEECGWKCPFTGRVVSLRGLVGDEPDFYVRHIIPFAQSLDDSIANKTLCHSSEAETSGRPPRDAYGAGPRWEGIELRVRAFAGSLAREKLRRFRLTVEDVAAEYGANYAERYDSDSSYAATLAVSYLATLGCGVSAVRGGAARFVRNLWGLGSIFDEERADYRAGVLGATCTAITTPALVRRLSVAAVKAPPGKRKRFADIDPPWKDFRDEVRAAALGTTVSFRVSRKARGALHEQTHHGLRGDKFQVRKPVAALSPTEVGAIRGELTRAAVVAALAKAGATDPRKAFAHGAPPPFHPNGNPILRVHVERNERAFAVGSGSGQRYVTSETNHHLTVHSDGKGWTRALVSQFDAQGRLRRKSPIVDRSNGFQFSIAVGEIVQIGKECYRVRSVSKDPRVAYVSINDARKMADIIAAREFYRESVDQLRQGRCKKVTIDPIGRVRDARD